MQIQPVDDRLDLTEGRVKLHFSALMRVLGRKTAPRPPWPLNAPGYSGTKEKLIGDYTLTARTNHL